MTPDNWKTIILSRYLGEYQPADNSDYSILKSSEDIKFDLEGMGHFSLEEISEEMVKRSYRVTIEEDGKPKWLLKKDEIKMLK